MRHRSRAADDGFSLIEVVVALFLLGIVAAAALTFFVRAMQNTSHLQRTQASVAVANQAMELARAVTPREVDTVQHVSGLVIGRSSTEVNAAWAAYPADVALMNKVSDPLAAARPVIPSTGLKSAVPVVRTTTVGGIDYKVTTLIGTCYRPIAKSTSEQNCVKTGTTSDLVMYRVIVVVSWEGSKAGQCTTASPCEYRTSTLIDPTVDADWNLTAKPVAYDDAISSTAGTTTTLPTNVLANDIIGAFTANPTTITANPGFGTATPITSGSSLGFVTYVPGSASGLTEFRYKLKDAAGRQSNEAVVLVSVNPVAVADSASATAGGDPIEIDVLANDLGTGLTIVPTGGSASVAGGKLQYTPSASVGNVTLKYKAVDSSGLASADVNVVVTQVMPVTPGAGNPSSTLPFSGFPTSPNLDLLGKTGNPPNYTITLKSGPSAGTVTLNAPTNTVATFNQLAGQAPGNYTFGFTVTNPAGPKTSPQGTYTITISPPVAVQDTLVSMKDNAPAPTVAVAANDTPAPTQWNGKLKLVLRSASSNANCGSASVVSASNGTVKVTPKSTSISKSCTFTYTYRLENTSGSSYSSNEVTNTVTVNP